MTFSAFLKGNLNFMREIRLRFRTLRLFVIGTYRRAGSEQLPPDMSRPIWVNWVSQLIAKCRYTCAKFHQSFLQIIHEQFLQKVFNAPSNLLDGVSAKIFIPFSLFPCRFLLYPLSLAVLVAPLSGAESPRMSIAKSGFPETKLAISSDTLLEEGKALFESGQYVAALGRFMTVLRKEPHQPEARQYLRLIVDEMRQNPTSMSSKNTRAGNTALSNMVVQEELRAQMRKRADFSLDLKAIPGVELNLQSSFAQVQIDSTLLFADESGVLKEQGIPILDRVSAWLKTYGQQPIIIHCYPEELQETSTNGSLFLKRYSELFSFFVEERRLAPQRFVSADLLKREMPVALTESTVDVSSATPAARVVIETLGSQSRFLEAMPSSAPEHSLKRWLEFAIMPTRTLFNPEEGEWVTLDLAAMTRTGLRNWTFEIVPVEGKNRGPLMRLEGNTNLLKRISWDGHNEKTGSLAGPGSYIARLTATDSDGTIMNRDLIVQVQRSLVDEPLLVAKRPPTPSTSRKSRPKKEKTSKPAPETSVTAPIPEVASLPSSGGSAAPMGGGALGTGTNTGATAPATGLGASSSDSLLDSPPGENPSAALAQEADAWAKSSKEKPETPAVAPAVSEEPAGEESVDSAHAIWKQVIQFEPNASELKPTVKASLERIGKTLEVYPLQKVRITGFAKTSEPNATTLARKRAETVRSILVDQYHVAAERVIVAGGKTTSSNAGNKVEMTITN